MRRDDAAVITPYVADVLTRIRELAFARLACGESISRVLVGPDVHERVVREAETGEWTDVRLTDVRRTLRVIVAPDCELYVPVDAL